MTRHTSPTVPATTPMITANINSALVTSSSSPELGADVGVGVGGCVIRTALTDVAEMEVSMPASSSSLAMFELRAPDSTASLRVWPIASAASSPVVAPNTAAWTVMVNSTLTDELCSRRVSAVAAERRRRASVHSPPAISSVSTPSSVAARAALSASSVALSSSSALARAVDARESNESSPIPTQAQYHAHSAHEMPLSPTAAETITGPAVGEGVLPGSGDGLGVGPGVGTGVRSLKQIYAPSYATM